MIVLAVDTSGKNGSLALVRVDDHLTTPPTSDPTSPKRGEMWGTKDLVVRSKGSGFGFCFGFQITNYKLPNYQLFFVIRSQVLRLRYHPGCLAWEGRRCTGNLGDR